MVWLVRMLMGLGVPVSEDSVWPAFMALMREMAEGEFPLRGCEVTHWSVQRGLARTDFVRICIKGAVGTSGIQDGITITMVYLHEENATLLAWVQGVRPAWGRAVVLRADVAKRVLGFGETCA